MVDPQNYVRNEEGGYPKPFMARGSSFTKLHLPGF